MKKHFKLAVIIIFVIATTFLVTWYFSAKVIKASFVSAVQESEAFNTFHRIRSHDRLEQLLIEGCNKEALEYVQMEQSLELLGLQDKLKNGVKLDQALVEENPTIVTRANKIKSKGKYYIPSCN